METAREFTVRLQELLRREHGALAEFLVALAAFDQRRAWAELGHASLFAFLHRDLGLSKGAAFYRATAAGPVQRFPDVVEPLRDGRLCLMSVAEVARVLTRENHREVLPRFFGMSKREAQALAAELQPAAVPSVRTVVTAVRAPAATIASLPPDTGVDLAQAVLPVEPRAAPATGSDDDRGPASMSAPAAPAPRPTAVEPLTAELTRIHVTLPRRVLDKVEAARAALSHCNPGAGLAEIIEAGIDLLLDRHARRKGLVKKPRETPRPSGDPEYVPAHVRREVWKRDGGRCQYPVTSGGECGNTLRVELHHSPSRFRGGRPTVEDLTLRCGFHHDVETRREFGDAMIDAIVRTRRSPTLRAGGRYSGAVTRRPTTPMCPRARGHRPACMHWRDDRRREPRPSDAALDVGQLRAEGPASGARRRMPPVPRRRYRVATDRSGGPRVAAPSRSPPEHERLNRVAPRRSLRPSNPHG